MLQRIKENYFLFILILFFMLVFCTNLQIGLFGDDYFYASFPKLGFWKMQVKHYLEANGRSLVHFLDSIFIMLPSFCWAIFNSICIVGIGFLQGKIIAFLTHSPKALRKSVLIYMISFLSLSVMVVRQSIYWKTGSFNYVFPIFIFFWYWYTLIKAYKTNFDKSYFLKVCILGLISAATVEQVAMMTFGLTLLLLIHMILLNCKNEKKMTIKPLLIILACTLVRFIIGDDCTFTIHSYWH